MGFFYSKFDPFSFVAVTWPKLSEVCPRHIPLDSSLSWLSNDTELGQVRFKLDLFLSLEVRTKLSRLGFEARYMGF